MILRVLRRNRRPIRIGWAGESTVTNNILLNLISDPIAENYPGLLSFCRLKKNGLRKQAFEQLAVFINEAGQWEEVRQREFADWLFDWIESSDDPHHLLVYPLAEQLLKPILTKWMVTKDPRPYRWYGLFFNTAEKMDYLLKALEYGGTREQKVILAIINSKLENVWFATHHIAEDAYLGDIDTDLQTLSEINGYVPMIQNEEVSRYVRADVDYYTNLINDWREFSSRQSSGFVDWCRARGREYEWVKSYYY